MENCNRQGNEFDSMMGVCIIQAIRNKAGRNVGMSAAWQPPLIKIAYLEVPMRPDMGAWLIEIHDCLPNG